MGSWAFGLMDSQGHGLSGAWALGVMGSRAHGLSGSWAHGLMGYRALGSNWFERSERRDQLTIFWSDFDENVYYSEKDHHTGFNSKYFSRSTTSFTWQIQFLDQIFFTAS
jgi:hypothetical protein